MASLFIKARNLSVGDTMLLPFGKTATIRKLRVPTGPNARYVTYTTEFGRGRMPLDADVSVEARAS
jgi:hypothetical protein